MPKNLVFETWVCYTKLEPEKGFDGYSHKALHRWIHYSANRLGLSGEVTWIKALGFAIQVDKDGYYIRFASTLNESPGQSQAGRTFVKRQVAEQVYILCCIPWGRRMVDAPLNPLREPRDLPMQWSRFEEEVLARDLELALISRHKVKSRDEDQMTRLTRFEREADGIDSIETGIRLV